MVTILMIIGILLITIMAIPKEESCNTGITFNQLNRTPSKYEGEEIKFTGKVIQAVEEEFYIIRLAIDSNYDNIMFVVADLDIIDERIIENDKITVYGIFTGLTTYDAVLGNKITIPSMFANTIKQIN